MRAIVSSIVHRLKRKKFSSVEILMLVVAVSAALVFIRGEDTRNITERISGDVKVIQQDVCSPLNSQSSERVKLRAVAACERLLNRLLALMTPEERRVLARSDGSHRRQTIPRVTPPPPSLPVNPTVPDEPSNPQPSNPEHPGQPAPENPPSQPQPPQVPPEPEPPQLIPIPQPICDLLNPLLDVC